MSEPVHAAVLVPLHRAAGGAVHVTLIRRAASGAHAGEIALPGGKAEPGDASLAATAVREAVEEIGLAPGDIELLEARPPVATRSTNFLVHPFVARVRPPAAWRPQAAEVAEVLDLPLAALQAPHARTQARIDYPGFPGGLRVACFRVGDTLIWGATFRILEPLLDRAATLLEQGSSMDDA